MLKSCSLCGRVHSPNYNCKAKQDRSKEHFNKRTDKEFYNSSEWDDVRQEVLDMYNNVDLFSFYIKGKIVEANNVHHIEPLRGSLEGALEVGNLIPLSDSTHRFVHKLYKLGYKKELQKFLYVCKELWSNNNRQLGMLEKEFEKISKYFWLGE